MPVIIKDYPKWIDYNGEQTLVKTADEEAELLRSDEREIMLEELNALGKDLDPAEFTGASGMGALRAIYEVAIKEPTKKPKK